MDFNQSKLNKLLYVFSQMIILFWALWISVVSITDLCDFMVHLHLLPNTFPAVSGNINLVFGFLSRYDLDSIQIAYTVYTLIILSALTITLAYWRAFIASFTNKNHYVCRSVMAFLLNAGMVSFFLVIDEIFIQYEAGHNHMVRLSAILINFLVFYRLVTTMKHAHKTQDDCL